MESTVLSAQYNYWLVALSLAFGPVWRVLSPMRTVYLLLRRAVPQWLSRPRLSYPESWGYRPAAVGLFASDKPSGDSLNKEALLPEGRKGL